MVTGALALGEAGIVAQRTRIVAGGHACASALVPHLTAVTLCSTNKATSQRWCSYRLNYRLSSYTHMYWINIYFCVIATGLTDSTVDSRLTLIAVGSVVASTAAELTVHRFVFTDLRNAHSTPVGRRPEVVHSATCLTHYAQVPVNH